MNKLAVFVNNEMVFEFDRYLTFNVYTLHNTHAFMQVKFDQFIMWQI